MSDDSRPDSAPLGWTEVLEAEYRALYGEPPPSTDGIPADRLRTVHAALHAQGPSALCLSGGGIRSGTFALGVLQGLAHLGVLRSFTYVSTVSGGGYIGGWFTAWLQREGTNARDQVFRGLDPTQASSREDGNEAAPVRHIRRTCRYLAPQGGLVSADMWTVLATMGRNLLLNWLVILPLLAAALLVPRLYYAVISAVESGLVSGPCLSPAAPPTWFLALALGGFATAWAYTALTFAGRGGHWTQARFLGLFLTPLVGAAIFTTFFWSAFPCNLDLVLTLAVSALLPAIAWILFGPRRRAVLTDDQAQGPPLLVRSRIRPVIAAVLSGPILGAGAWWFATYPFGFGDGEPLRELYAVAAVPLVLALVVLSIAIFVGLASKSLDDAALEWWSRCSAWIGIAAFVWLVAAALVFYMADLMEAGLHAVDEALNLRRQTSATIFAGIVPLLSSLAGLAARGRGEGQQRPSTLGRMVQAAALPLIIVALLSSLAWVNLRVLEAIEYHQAGPATPCSAAFVGKVDTCHPVGAGVGEILLYGAALVIVGLGMSAFVPSNRFSLHGMYRQRLIRTFLGASRRDRTPNAFTGFDNGDDLQVHDLRAVRPLHVINATLNAVSSTHVGRHERQAESFTFTPLHVGNTSVGYRPADQYGSDGGGISSGLSLGMALAVSGAAASSSMGIYSSKTRAFLLTLANARLGLWFGNPRNATTWKISDPALGVGPLVRELLGLTTDHNPYVYLSDGGHYENLGLWEMVARRCAFIVIADAGCDPEYRFDDLANAIRRIRLDLGIPIQFPSIPMTRDGQAHGNPHGVIGRIRYSVVDGADAPDGTILYLKATLSGDEPIDVLNFAQSDTAFPHDSTSDQFFDEAHFESYRTLGFHTVLSVAHQFEGGDVEAFCRAAAEVLPGPAPGHTAAAMSGRRGAAAGG